MYDMFVSSKTSGSNFYPPFWNKKDLLKKLNDMGWRHLSKDEVVNHYIEKLNVSKEIATLCFSKRFVAYKKASDSKEAMEFRKECENVYMSFFKGSGYSFSIKKDNVYLY